MKKARIIVFILMIFTALLPTLRRLITRAIMALGIKTPFIAFKQEVSSVAVISGADGPTVIFIAGRISPTVIAALVLFVVWLILCIKTRKKKQEEGEL